MVMGVACGIGGDGLNDIINDEDKSDIVGDNNSHNGVNDDDSGVGGSVGLMGLVSQAVHDGGRHVLGFVLTLSHSLLCMCLL